MSRFGIDIEVERNPRGGEPFRLAVDLATREGITVICGPSGAGKSTLLHALLGAPDPTRGRVVLGERTLFDSERGVRLPTHRRRVGMVLQDVPLFPHLTVGQNVAFGIRGADRPERTRDLLAQVGAETLIDRRPGELSGGQRQRVALARALGPGPEALLLDEPFSALDAGARRSLGRLLVELQQSAAIPFLHVTHDLTEAVRLGTHLILIDGGRMIQAGPPMKVISRPASPAAAAVVGTENLFNGRVVAHRPEEGCTEIDVGGTTVLSSLLDVAPGERVTLGIRAEDILVSLEPLHRTSARNLLRGTVQSLAAAGARFEVLVTAPAPFRVHVTPVSVRELELEPGKPVYLVIKAAAFHHLV